MILFPAGMYTTVNVKSALGSESGEGLRYSACPIPVTVYSFFNHQPHPPMSIVQCTAIVRAYHHHVQQKYCRSDTKPEGMVTITGTHLTPEHLHRIDTRSLMLYATSCMHRIQWFLHPERSSPSDILTDEASADHNEDANEMLQDMLQQKVRTECARYGRTVHEGRLVSSDPDLLGRGAVPVHLKPLLEAYAVPGVVIGSAILAVSSCVQGSIAAYHHTRMADQVRLEATQGISQTLKYADKETRDLTGVQV